VELVTVILILGVLAAVALPRYADLQGKAREAKVKGVAGSIQSAASLAKASAMANGNSCGADSTISMEGRTINLNNCYPQALTSFTDGIMGAANISTNDGWTVGGGGATAGTALTLQLAGGSTPANCAISYAAPASANAAPAVSYTTSGC
jgi:MSHA pilin protein MshA